MALSFEYPMTHGDFVPEIEESVKDIFVKHLANGFASDSYANDNYDSYGRNISAQERRQNLVPWIQVRYDSRGRLFIPVSKKVNLKKILMI